MRNFKKPQKSYKMAQEKSAKPKTSNECGRCGYDTSHKSRPAIGSVATFARKKTTSQRNVYSRQTRRKGAVRTPLMKKRVKTIKEAATVMRAATHIWCIQCIR